MQKNNDVKIDANSIIRNIANAPNNTIVITIFINSIYCYDISFDKLVQLLLYK